MAHRGPGARGAPPRGRYLSRGCTIGRCSVCSLQREAGRRRQGSTGRRSAHALGRLRARHGLFARADLERWLAANGMAPERLDFSSRIRSVSRRSGRWPNPALRDRLLDELRLRGDYARLAARGRDKQERLTAQGPRSPQARGPERGPRAAPGLVFRAAGLARPLPDDIEAAARELGFADRTEFYRALLREYLYCSGCEHAVQRDREN